MKVYVETRLFLANSPKINNSMVTFHQWHTNSIMILYTFSIFFYQINILSIAKMNIEKDVRKVCRTIKDTYQ